MASSSWSSRADPWPPASMTFCRIRRSTRAALCASAPSAPPLVIPSHSPPITCRGVANISAGSSPLPAIPALSSRSVVVIARPENPTHRTPLGLPGASMVPSLRRVLAPVTQPSSPTAPPAGPAWSRDGRSGAIPASPRAPRFSEAFWARDPPPHWLHSPSPPLRPLFAHPLHVGHAASTYLLLRCAKPLHPGHPCLKSICTSLRIPSFISRWLLLFAGQSRSSFFGPLGEAWRHHRVFGI